MLGESRGALMEAGDGGGRWSHSEAEGEIMPAFILLKCFIKFFVRVPYSLTRLFFLCSF